MKIKGEKSLSETKWLSFKEIEYIDKLGNEKKWSYVERIGKPKVVTIICKSKSNKYIDCIVGSDTGNQLANLQASKQFELYTGKKWPL